LTSERETIMNVLFGLLQNVDGINTCSRKLKLWADVPAQDRPALFLTEHKENIVRTVEGMPAKRRIFANIFLYIDSKSCDVPMTELNNLIDAISTALRPTNPMQEQTLNGLVAHCWIEGDIVKDPGDLDGDGLAIIPISIIIP
jgi:hypothetical protein